MTRGSPPPKEKPPTAGKHREGQRQHGRPQDITRSRGIPGDREKNLGAVLRRTLGRIAGNVEAER